MWLLDVNIPLSVMELLKKFNVTAEPSEKRGWRELENGDLVTAAVGAGFSCLLTKDKRFSRPAAKTLKKISTFSVVIVEVPQVREALYLAAFEVAWIKTPIKPKPGKCISWP